MEIYLIHFREITTKDGIKGFWICKSFRHGPKEEQFFGLNKYKVYTKKYIKCAKRYVQHWLQHEKYLDKKHNRQVEYFINISKIYGTHEKLNLKERFRGVEKITISKDEYEELLKDKKELELMKANGCKLTHF